MLKRIFKIIGVFILLTMVSYLVGIFISAEVNPMNWLASSRMLFVGFIGIATEIYAIFFDPSMYLEKQTHNSNHN